MRTITRTSAITGGYELSPSGSGWTLTFLYSLVPEDGFYFQYPSAGVIIDSEGNLYGTGQSGPGAPGYGGAAYELTPAPPPWNFTYLYINKLGGFAEGGVARDAAGNVYGRTTAGGEYGGGTVY